MNIVNIIFDITLSIIPILITCIFSFLESKDFRKKRLNSEEENKIISEDLFSFELIQKKENLLKRNTGPNVCVDPPKIEYVEYCDSIKYLEIRGTNIDKN